jgi:geranylgeranyl diphosphate synthase, type II
MLKASDCYRIIEEEISELVFNEEPVGLYKPIRYILSLGGKRVRPCLTLLANNLFSDKFSDAVYPALAIEIFHNFTLLHDDIMDNAPTRRNKETVHIKWDRNTAILSGDAMMIFAYDVLNKTTVESFPKIFTLFNKTALEVCEGQQFDIEFENRSEVPIREYIEMIRLKTAVLIAASLAVGAISANAPSSDIDKLYQFGLNIGLAFQLQDDYLDVFANTDEFGKSIGGDILANKKTFLMISALNSSNLELVNKLHSWTKKEDFIPVEKIKAVTEIYRKLKIDKQSRIFTDDYFNKGLRFLEEVKVPKTRKTELEHFVFNLMRRER